MKTGSSSIWLCTFLSGCFLFPQGQPRPGQSPASPTSDGRASTNGTGSSSASIDRETFAPPEGLPDLRPLFGLDPNQWTFAFIPGVTRRSTADDILETLRGVKVAKRETRDDFTWVKVIPEDAESYPGLSWAELGFKKDETGASRAYDVTIHFKRRYRFEPALRTYVQHLTRLNFGRIRKPDDDIQTIIGPESAMAQVSKAHDGELRIKLTFPKKSLFGRSAPALTKPTYAAVRTIDEADYAPPEGMPDGRKVLGLDPDHWAPAFLPVMVKGTPEAEVISTIEEAGFALRGRPKPGDSAFLQFVSKQKDVAPGVKLLTAYVVEDDEWEGRGLRSLELEMAPGLNRQQAYVDHLVSLVQLNFAGAEPEEVDDIMSVNTDDFTSFQLANHPRKLTLRFDAPPFPL